MIRLTDWVATVPAADKRLAYVGENEADTRQFLLTGEKAAAYADWGFHLDMAFDLSTVTQVSTAQTEQTEENQQESISDTAVSLTATTTRQTKQVTDVTVDCQSKTDVAALEKTVTEEGLVLTWVILRQHTLLPGKLWATLRAVSPTGQVKKSAIMVFDVEPAVAADPAASVPLSEFEVMEARLDALVESAVTAADTVSQLAPQTAADAVAAGEAATEAAASVETVRQLAAEAQTDAQLAAACADKAETRVESVLERNDRLPLCFWVGTQTEYDALAEKPNNCFCIITDDTTIPDVEELVAAMQAQVEAMQDQVETLTLNEDRVTKKSVLSGWTYRLWDSGIAECWCTVALGIDSISAGGSAYNNFTFPITFYEAPTVHVDVIHDSTSPLSHHIQKVWTTRVYVCVNNSGTAAVSGVSLAIKAVGLWKAYSGGVG